MMGTARVVITFEGLEQVISRLTEIEERAPASLQKQTEALADATQASWKQATPVRTGRLQGADTVDVGDLSFTLVNATKYYRFLNEGHMTPMGWRTKRGYRPAKRRSRVAGRYMTEKAIQFVESNAFDYLSKFLDDI